MALAGSSPSARQQREFGLMCGEKVAAFYESWNAMAFEALRANQSLALSMLQSALRVRPSGCGRSRPEPHSLLSRRCWLTTDEPAYSWTAASMAGVAPVCSTGHKS